MTGQFYLCKWSLSRCWKFKGSNNSKCKKGVVGWGQGGHLRFFLLKPFRKHHCALPFSDIPIENGKCHLLEFQYLNVIYFVACDVIIVFFLFFVVFNLCVFKKLSKIDSWLAPLHGTRISEYGKRNTLQSSDPPIFQSSNLGDIF